MSVILHGPAYSTYARTARLALEEKGVAYELNEVDILSGKGQDPAHRALQPWGKVPAFEHDGFGLFETFAIARYVDEAFPGPSLQPADAKSRARMTQICGVIDSYGYGSMVGKVFWQEVVVPMQGGKPDADVIAAGRQEAEKVLDVIHRLMESGTMCGEAISLADLHVLPPLDYYRMTPSGAAAFDARPKLAFWWERMSVRESVAKTRPKLG
jgi:glutathione S-transferase